MRNSFFSTLFTNLEIYAIKGSSTLSKYYKIAFPKRFITPSKVLQGKDLTNLNCLITGANSGIGYEVTKSMALSGCNVTMACRNVEYSEEAITEISKLNTEAALRCKSVELNLASLSSVKKLADELNAIGKKYNIVILNAAIFGLPYTLTQDGIETVFQVNHLSQLYFILSIKKILMPGSRVIFIASEMHRYVNPSFQELEMKKDNLSLSKLKYSAIKSYNISKLCNVLAMHYLSRIWRYDKISFFAASPGSFIKTNICRNWWVYRMLFTAMLPFSKNVVQAASTPVYCAVANELNGFSGHYFKDCELISESDLARNFHLATTTFNCCKDIIKEHLERDITLDSLKDSKNDNLEAEQTMTNIN